MPVSRMRMRPWLEMMIESNSIPGLTWIDKEKTMFSIPWKHAAQHGWEMEKDASRFDERAIHTGKYIAGQNSDPKTWKANFRCAMNSLPDIEEVKDRSINKGHQAMRVFRMLPSSPKARDKRIKARETKARKKSSVIKMEEGEDLDYSDTQSPSAETQPESTQENTVDSTVQTDQPEYLTSVPDWSFSVEIGPDLLSNRFQVSPEHCSEPEYNEDIVEICRSLEKEAMHWMSLEDMGFLSNEECTSPGSQWSDSSSSGDDIEEMPQYTTLGEFCSTDDMWPSFFPQIRSTL